MPSNLMKINNFAVLRAEHGRKSDDRRRQKWEILYPPRPRDAKEKQHLLIKLSKNHSISEGFHLQYACKRSEAVSGVVFGECINIINWECEVMIGIEKYVEERLEKVWCARSERKPSINGNERCSIKVLLINLASEECSLLMDSI